jgi:hypothetical protein
MSKKTASLLVGLLAIAEGQSSDRNLLSEANNADVLNVIAPELLDSIAKRLYSDAPEHLSAYERLIQDDKQRKMDYLNNVRRDAASNSMPSPSYYNNDMPPSHHDHVVDIDPEVKGDPSTIKDRILAEQERVQKNMMAYKSKEKED